MVRLRAVHVIAAFVIIAIFVVSTILVLLDHYGLVTASLFSFLSIIGAYFPPVEDVVDARNGLVLASVVLGVLGNVAFTIMFTSLFYQVLSRVDVRYIFSKRRIRRVSKHVIITPVNGMGIELARRLREHGIGAVFIEPDKRLVRKNLRNGYLTLHGSASDSDTLADANVGGAIALFALHDSDIQNVFATMEAKRMNRRVRVIARIRRLEDIPKMERAGARRVILPEAAVGAEIGEFLTKNAG